MRLFTETQDQGPELVLVHGWGMNGEVWEGIVRPLAQHYRVTTVDLPGHGRSVESPRDYTLPTLAAELRQVVPDNAILVGWSLGGQVATQLALDNPGLLKQLVLVASAPRFERSSDWPQGVDAQVLSSFAGDLRTDFKNTVKRFIAIQAMGSDNPRELQRSLRERVFRHGEPQIAALEGGLNILHATDLRARLQQVHCPVLLLTGEHDTLFRPAAARATQALISNAKLSIIKGAGHAPFISHPDAFLRALTAFLQQ